MTADTGVARQQYTHTLSEIDKKQRQDKNKTMSRHCTECHQLFFRTAKGTSGTKVEVGDEAGVASLQVVLQQRCQLCSSGWQLLVDPLFRSSFGAQEVSKCNFLLLKHLLHQQYAEPPDIMTRQPGQAVVPVMVCACACLAVNGTCCNVCQHNVYCPASSHSA